MVKLEAGNGIGQQRSRRAPRLHQTQHVIVNRTHPGNLAQDLVAEGRERCTHAAHEFQASRRRLQGWRGYGLKRCVGQWLEARFTARLRNVVKTFGYSALDLECGNRSGQRQRIEQAKDRACHAFRALFRGVTVDSLVDAITGVDDPGQHQHALASGNEQCQRAQAVDPLYERLHHRAQVVPVDLGIITDGVDAGHGRLLHGQHQFSERVSGRE